MKSESIKDINGNYIRNPIGYCHFKGHEGALDTKLAYKHKCKGKKCKYLEKYIDKAFEKPMYVNVNKGVKK